MLKVKTELGIGKDILYAGEFIKKGQPVWFYTEGVDMQVHSDDLPEDLRDYFDKYATCVELYESKYIYELDGDDCKYMRHSTSPNVIFSGNLGLAVKDIEINEELTFDLSVTTTKNHYNYLTLINES